MSDRCGAEECAYWDGDGCPCAAFGIDPPEPGTDPLSLPSATYSVTVPAPEEGEIEVSTPFNPAPSTFFRMYQQNTLIVGDNAITGPPKMLAAWREGEIPDGIGQKGPNDG